MRTSVTNITCGQQQWSFDELGQLRLKYGFKKVACTNR